MVGWPSFQKEEKSRRCNTRSGALEVSSVLGTATERRKEGREEGREGGRSFCTSVRLVANLSPILQTTSARLVAVPRSTSVRLLVVLWPVFQTTSVRLVAVLRPRTPSARPSVKPIADGFRD
ncbi:hypothetical protein EYF80_047051 [Liparis tanakae]|uniref:Uncharacterized protein n=1 Tax=Liparis tanakae TaxID=230148 RepID=A0A4Z2FPD1_9TELE|nr:hypothetical protein EYF80_047051 [Liparis tanakae]